MLKKILLPFWFSLCLLLPTQCGSQYISIPVPTVHFVVRPYSIDNELATVGGYKIFEDKGYLGIFIYRLSHEEFLAYDLACPNHYQDLGTVKFNPQTLVLEANCCPTKFNILNGFPENSTLPSPLYQYSVRWQGNQELLVTNQ